METIGNKLKTAREKQKMTPSDVAQATRIRTDYVVAIEKNEFHKLIAPVYARGFIKLYAQCVRIEHAPLLRQFDATENREERISAERELQAKKEIPVSKKRRLMRIGFAGLVNAIGKIRLPDIKRLENLAFKPVELPGKKWLALIIAAAIGIVILPIFIRHIAAPDAKIRVPAACRWIADPPEPYLDIPAQKSQNSR
ncbi:MAG: helix-turn-helix domain-containing protein [Kiritimatiellia bacterium]|nr:helix-turn-helix domain-containing protein [Kiritimatiellia bacterium]